MEIVQPTQTATQPSAEDFLADGHTPMMAQYMAAKASAPDCLLFYRMGDFYELFFEDAEKASAALDIALTRRGKTQGTDIPMCGIPFHSSEGYIARLIRSGYKVAICEQIETPEEAKKRGGAKALVRREIVRLVTPGTVMEDSLLDARSHNYLAALTKVSGQMGFAWLDMSTGAFSVQSIEEKSLSAAIERIEPSEIVAPESLSALLSSSLSGPRLTIQPESLFDSENARRRLEDAFSVADTGAFGALTRAEVAAAGALIDYVARTQIGKIPHLSRPHRFSPGGTMEIDAATRRNLELTRTLSGERRGSLLDTIDRTATGPGARMLGEWLSAPSCDLSHIRSRQDQVHALIENLTLRTALRAIFRELPDIERALARLTAGRGGPRDLCALREGLKAAHALAAALDRTQCPPLMEKRQALAQESEVTALADTLTAALNDAPPFLARDGGFVRPGYNPVLDEALSLQKNGRKIMAEMEARYRAQTGIESLKITYNNILGYYIEIPARRADKILEAKNDPDNPFIHRQTMANAVRFTSVELSELEKNITTAADRALAIELEIFGALAAQAAHSADALARIARAAAELDVVAGLAELAGENGWTRPDLDDSQSFFIEGGRHPVVERALKDSGTPFVPNDCDLSPANRLWLLTGPNMAGKSTFLRQNALIAILAQSGSFVPARSARIGIIDRVFSRVGASDDLARGRSTFMVEMVETAAILSQATEKSLVILDEIGRGTATFDGLSIAWACVEHLHEICRSRALFATHYHELSTLETRMKSIACHSMQVREWKNDIVFLHTVAKGAADRSYGIHVAQIAGLPPAVITRAREILTLLEKGEQSSALTRLAEDLPLFSALTSSISSSPSSASASAAPVSPGASSVPSALVARLSALDIDSLSPRSALEELYALKALLTAPERG